MGQREIDAAQLADAAKFEEILARYLAGEVAEDAFRIFRLNNGIYGQRQGGHNQMVRVKIPWGGMLPDQLERWPTWPTPTPRLGPHPPPGRTSSSTSCRSRTIPEVMRLLGTVGMTTRGVRRHGAQHREHLAGACPHEKLDITPWAEAAYQHFVRNPLGQRLPQVQDQLLGLRHRLRPGDVQRRGRHRHHPHPRRRVGRGGLPRVRRRRPGRQPHPPWRSRSSPPRKTSCPPSRRACGSSTATATATTSCGPLVWLVDTLGWEDVQARIVKERRLLLGSSSWPGGIPDARWPRPAAHRAWRSTWPRRPWARAFRSRSPSRPFEQWDDTNVVRGAAKGTVSAIAYARLGDVTSEQFLALAAIQRDLGLEVRLTNRQNVDSWGLTEEQLPVLYRRHEAIGMSQPGAELVRDVVTCPGADTCNLAVTQSRGLGAPSARSSRRRDWPRWRPAHQHLGLHQQLRPAPHVRHRLLRRRAPGQQSLGPGYQMLLGGFVGDEKVHFGDKALRLPARNAAEATARGAPVAGRAPGRRVVPRLDGPGGRRQGPGGRPQGARPLPLARRGPRVLRGLRRDRPVRGRSASASAPASDGGTFVSFLVEPPALPVPAFHDEELAELNAEFERLPAPKIIQWAATTSLLICASPPRCRAPCSSTWPPRSSRASRWCSSTPATTSRETLETVERVRRRYGLNLRMMTVAHHDEELWKVDPENCCSAVKVGQLDRALAGKAAWMSGLRRDEASTRPGRRS